MATTKERRDKNLSPSTHTDRPDEGKAKREGKATSAEKAKAKAATNKEQGEPQPLSASKAVEFIKHGLKKLATVCADAGNVLAGVIKSVESAPEREAERAAAFGLYQIGDLAMRASSSFSGKARLEEYQKVWQGHMPSLTVQVQVVETDPKTGRETRLDKYRPESPSQWREVIEAVLVSVMGVNEYIDPAVIRTTEMAIQRAAKAYQAAHTNFAMPKLGNRAGRRGTAGTTKAGMFYVKPGVTPVAVKAGSGDHVDAFLESIGGTDKAVAFVLDVVKRFSLEVREALVEAIENLSTADAAGEKAA